MSRRRVLLVSSADSTTDIPIYLEVRQENSKDQSITITATDTTDVYLAAFRPSNIKQNLVESLEGGDEEWHQTVLWKLLGHPLDSKYQRPRQSIELMTEVRKESFVDLHFIRTIQTAKNKVQHKLGAFKLKYTEDVQLDTFEWIGSAVEARDEAESNVARLELELAAKDESTQKLQSQLEDLIKAKERHENVLLERAMHLINAKKLKIRDQQRILATAKPDRARVDEVMAARDGAESRSRKTKRKVTEMPDFLDDSSDEFETMKLEPRDSPAIDPVMQSPDEEDRATPEASEEDTDDEPFAAPSPPKAKPTSLTSRPPSGLSTAANPPTAETSTAATISQHVPSAEDMEEDTEDDEL